MRKLISILFLLVLVLSAAVTGYAQGADLQLSDAEAAPGDVVYLTLSLKEPLEADAMGLSYTYDDKVLEPMSGSSWSWEVKGVIQNFDIKKSRAVWGANDPIQLQGDICVMAFRVLEKAKLTQTRVACELIIKNRGDEVGVYAAEALVGKHCEHEYSPWVAQDESWHTAQCKLCEKVITQSHMWDDGVEKTEDQNHLLRYTCADCLKTKDIVLGDAFTNNQKPSQSGNAPTTDISPTVPKVEADPTIPNTNLVQTAPTTGGISGNSQNLNGGAITNPDDNTIDYTNDQLNADKNQNSDGELGDGHSHVEENQEQTVPTNDDHILVEPTAEHTHDHAEHSANENNPITGIVVAAAVVILLGAAIYFVKKK